jgi:hypothetical protein
MDEQQQIISAATSIAALALAQGSFIALIGSALFSKAEAEEYLRRSIETDQNNGGAPNRAAASILGEILKNVTAMQVATRQ